MDLEGKTALVTGASHGIGMAIADALEKEGCKVIRISRSHGYDVMKEEDMQKITELVLDCDILINNVGGGGTWKIQDWFKVWQKNYMTAFLLTMAFINKPKKEWGRVITISSIYGKEAGGTPWFNVAKVSQIALMKNLAGRYEGLTFNTICPGFIDVGKPFPEEPSLKFVGKPEDVANIVAFLCTDKAKFINGACIVVDGGVSRSY